MKSWSLIFAHSFLTRCPESKGVNPNANSNVPSTEECSVATSKRSMPWIDCRLQNTAFVFRLIRELCQWSNGLAEMATAGKVQVQVPTKYHWVQTIPFHPIDESCSETQFCPVHCNPCQELYHRETCFVSYPILT